MNQRRLHIAIVDAHVDSCDMYAEALAWFGFGVTALSTAHDVEETLRSEVPDAIVTSLRYGGINGFGLCDLLRANPRTARVPVIALSTCVPDFERAVHDGRFEAVLMKPCLPDALRAVITAAVASPGECRT